MTNSFPYNVMLLIYNLIMPFYKRNQARFLFIGHHCSTIESMRLLPTSHWWLFLVILVFYYSGSLSFVRISRRWPTFRSFSGYTDKSEFLFLLNIFRMKKLCWKYYPFSGMWSQYNKNKNSISIPHQIDVILTSWDLYLTEKHQYQINDSIEALNFQRKINISNRNNTQFQVKWFFDWVEYKNVFPIFLYIYFISTA